MLIDTRYHMTLRQCAEDLGRSPSVLYNYRTYGVLPFPEPYFEGWGVQLYDIRVIRRWHKTVPPPGAPGNKRTRDPRRQPAFRDESGSEHVSQGEIARRLAVSRQAVSNWITREDFPRVTYTFGQSNLRHWGQVKAWRARDLKRQVVSPAVAKKRASGAGARPHTPEQVSVKIRGREHVTQGEIARRLGVGKPAVSNWAKRHEDFPPAVPYGPTPMRDWLAVKAWHDHQLEGRA